MVSIELGRVISPVKSCPSIIRLIVIGTKSSLIEFFISFLSLVEKEDEEDIYLKGVTNSEKSSKGVEDEEEIEGVKNEKGLKDARGIENLKKKVEGAGDTDSTGGTGVLDN